MAKDIDILQFINALRESDEYIETIYTQGSCYRLHLLLKTFFPECEPLISEGKGHIVSEYQGKLYDITGEVTRDGFSYMDQDDIETAEKWSFYKHNYLAITECPECETTLCYGRNGVVCVK